MSVRAAHPVFLSHTRLMAEQPRPKSFVQAAINAVLQACHLPRDMRWFTASSDAPADACEREVRECAVYVGIFGFDYGSPVRDRPDLSYTQLEFRTALEKSKSGLPMKVFAFVLDEAKADGSLFGPLDERQQAFRREVLDCGITARRFYDAEQLEGLILQTLLKELPPIRSNRPQQHLRYRAVSFQGRRRELDNLLEQIQQGDRTLAFVSTLKGTGGVGKTALAAQVAQHLNNSLLLPGGILWTNLLEEHFSDAARRWVLDLGGDPLNLSPDACVAKFHELAAAAGGLLVVLDNAQVPKPAADNPVEQLLVKAPGVITLITTRFQEAAPVSVSVRDVDELDDPDAHALLESTLGRDVLDRYPAETGALIRVCDRLPLFLNAAAAAVRNRRIPLPTFIQELTRRGLTALAKGDAKAAKVFEMSWDALSDLAKELFSVLALAPGDQVGAYLAAACLRQTQPELLKDEPWLAEQLLGEIANASLLLPAGEKRYRYHDRVRDFARSKLLISAAEAKCRLLACWTDWDMVHGEFQAAGAFSLAEQYLTLKTWNVPQPPEFLPWYCFIRGQASCLATAPEIFFQQAFNEPMASPVAAEAQQRVHVEAKPVHFLEWLNRPEEFHPPACLQTLQGHTDRVRAVSVAGDGRTAVSGSWDRSVRVWDLLVGRCTIVLQGHTGPVQAVGVTRDGRTAVSASWDQTVRVWSLASGRCAAVLEGHTDKVQAVGVSADGRIAVSGSWDQTVRVWSVATGRCTAVFEGHTGPVRSVSVTVDGHIAVTGSSDATVRVWDVVGSRCTSTLRGHGSAVVAVSATADGQTVVSGSDDGTVRAWDVVSGRCTARLKGKSGGVVAISATADGQTVVFGSDDKKIRVWRTASGRRIATLEGHGGSVHAVCVTSDALTAVSGSSDGSLRVWDLGTECRPATFQRHAGRVTAVSVTADGRTAVSGSEDTTLRVWDLAAGYCTATLRGHHGAVQGVRIARDGRTAVSGSWQDAEFELDLSGKNRRWEPWDGTVRVWNLCSGNCIKTYEEDDYRARRAWEECPEAARTVRTVITNGFLVLRRVGSDEALARTPGNFSNAACSEDGRRVIAGDGAGQVYLFHLRRRGE